MAQESGDQNKTSGFFQKNQILVWAVVIIVLGVVLYFLNRDSGDDILDTTADEETTQNGQDNGNSGQNIGSQNETDDGDVDGSASTTAGSVSATGILRASDNATRGNYMVESSRGKFYVKTVRDFSGMLGTTVVLNAEGTLNSYKFLGFNNGAVDQPDVGGAPDVDTQNVSFTGKLEKSESPSGDYVITSGANRVYLKTVHDYTSLVGSTVELKAMGTFNSFTGASLIKK